MIPTARHYESDKRGEKHRGENLGLLRCDSILLPSASLLPSQILSLAPLIRSFVREGDGERFQVLVVEMGGGGGGRCGGELRIGLGRRVSFDAVLRL